MADTIVPVGNEVKGDITQCRIETVKKSVQRKGSLSLSQKENFVTYDVCTKQIVTEYSNSSLTGVGVVGAILLVGIAFTVILFVMASTLDRY